MTWKSYAVVSGATVLAGWLASAPPASAPAEHGRERPRRAGSARRPRPRTSSARPRGSRCVSGAKSDYAQPQRNPFRFGAARPDVDGAATFPRLRLHHWRRPLRFRSSPRRRRVTLSGIAEDQRRQHGIRDGDSELAGRRPARPRRRRRCLASTASDGLKAKPSNS